jgi:hypothetical protein
MTALQNCFKLKENPDDTINQDIKSMLGDEGEDRDKVEG